MNVFTCSSVWSQSGVKASVEEDEMCAHGETKQLPFVEILMQAIIGTNPILICITEMFT